MNTPQATAERIGTTSREVEELMGTEEGRPAPEWIELIPAGEFSGRDGRGPYRLADPAKVIEATQMLGMDAGQPIDYDHATDLAAPQGHPAPAAGWIKELASKEGALWGRVEWTRHGAEALATREYRYVSPVFEHDENGEVVRLIRAALTNNPNLYIRAIAAKEENRARKAEAPQRPAERECSVARAILGLAQDTSSDELYAELHRVLMAVRGYESARDKEADTRDAEAIRNAGAADLTVMRARADRAVVEALRAGKITPAQRSWATAYCRMDFGGFQQFVERQPAIALHESAFGERSLRLVHGSKQEAVDPAGAELSANERAVCARLGIRPADYAKRKVAPRETGSLDQQ